MKFKNALDALVPVFAFSVLASGPLFGGCSGGSGTTTVDNNTSDQDGAARVRGGDSGNGADSSSNSSGGPAGSSSGTGSSSSGSGSSSGASSSGSGSTSGGSSSSSSGGGFSDSGTTDTGATASACGAMTSYNACLACCQQVYPTALQTLAKAAMGCDCGPMGVCKIPCATEFCTTGNATPGDACYMCIENSLIADAGAPCFLPIETACSADAECAAYEACALPCNALP